LFTRDGSSWKSRDTNSFLHPAISMKSSRSTRFQSVTFAIFRTETTSTSVSAANSPSTFGRRNLIVIMAAGQVTDFKFFCAFARRATITAECRWRNLRTQCLNKGPREAKPFTRLSSRVTCVKMIARHASVAENKLLRHRAHHRVRFRARDGSGRAQFVALARTRRQG